MNLAENIYKYRTQKNMSQLDLADALEVSRQSVSKWETGTAVPELEKLMKMSDLFGVSLDALVGRSSPEPATPAPPAVRWLTSVPPRKIVGAILLACAFLFFLACVVKNSIFEGFLWSLPLVLCGIICFICTRHVGLWCAWALYLPLLFIPLEQIMRIDIATTIELFAQIPLLAFTLLSFRKEKLEMTNKIKAFLIVGWSVWFIWFSMWLATLSAPAELFQGFSLRYMLEVLIFPLFTALLTVTVRVLKKL